MPDLDKLLELLKESKRDHDHCDDSWYCCGACRHPDHMLVEGEHIGSSIVGGVTFKPWRLHVRCVDVERKGRHGTARIWTGREVN